MDKPKIVSAIKYNGEIFSHGDIVDFVLDCGFSDKECSGRIAGIVDKTIKFDSSFPFNAYTQTINIESLKSISHAAEQEE